MRTSFKPAKKPYNENNEKLQNLFNIHSGGRRKHVGPPALLTFKALSEDMCFESCIRKQTNRDQATFQK